MEISWPSLSLSMPVNFLPFSTNFSLICFNVISTVLVAITSKYQFRTALPLALLFSTQETVHFKEASKFSAP